MITHYVLLKSKDGSSVSINGYSEKRKVSGGRSSWQPDIAEAGERVLLDNALFTVIADWLDNELADTPVYENYLKLFPNAYTHLKSRMVDAISSRYFADWRASGRLELSRRELVDRMTKAAKEVLPTFEKPKQPEEVL